jgi:hypothetical protein
MTAEHQISVSVGSLEKVQEIYFSFLTSTSFCGCSREVNTLRPLGVLLRSRASLLVKSRRKLPRSLSFVIQYHRSSVFGKLETPVTFYDIVTCLGYVTNK